MLVRGGTDLREDHGELSGCSWDEKDGKDEVP